MDIRKWYNKYSNDCALKYPSIRTCENYLSSVGSFLKHFEKEIEPICWVLRFANFGKLKLKLWKY